MKNEQAYREYLQSATWKAKRQESLIRAGHKCETCGSEGRLEVHHKTYDRFGQEMAVDLTVLCRSCHEKADTKRRQSRGASIRQIENFARRMYGEDWQAEISSAEASDQYAEWLTVSAARGNAS